MGLAVNLPGLVALRRSSDRGAPSAPPARVTRPAGGEGGGAPRGTDQARLLPLVPSRVRHAPPRGQLRHPHGPGAPRAQGREDHDGLHACVQPRQQGGAEPDGRVAGTGRASGGGDSQDGMLG